MDNNFDIIVVGAGPGGSSTAALLAQAGKKVLLVDKNKSAGGRMLAIHDDEGFHYELFPISGVSDQFDYVLDKIGKIDEVKYTTVNELGLENIMYFEDNSGNIIRWNQDTGFGQDFFKAICVPMDNTEGIAKIQKFMTDIMTMTEDGMQKLSLTPSPEFLDSYGEFPGLFRTFVLASFCEGTFEMTSDKVPASDMIRLFQESTRGLSGRYYEYGIGHVFEVFAEAVEDFGGTVLFNSRVKSIDVEGNEIKGITLENGEKFTAPIVISSAGIRQTVFNLVGQNKFEKDYCNRIGALVPSLACVGFRYFLNAPVLKSPMIVLFPEGCLESYEEFKEMAEGKRQPKRNYVYLGTTSLYRETAPEGKQLVYAVMSCYPDPNMDIQPYLDYIEKKIKLIEPDIFDHIERKEVMTPAQAALVGTDAMEPHLGGEAYGIANSIGQAGEQRPSPISPITGLYYVGNDAGGFGLGTHQAMDSGVNVAKMLLNCSNE